MIDQVSVLTHYSVDALVVCCLAVIGFASAAGFQSSANQLAKNRMTISVLLLAVAQVGEYLRISNFSNFQLSSGNVEFRNMTSATMATGVPIPSSIDTSGVFCDRGTLTHFQLEAHFCRESLAPEIFTLQFELVNFARIQEAPRIEIQLVSIAGVVLDTRNLELQAGKSHEEQMGVGRLLNRACRAKHQHTIVSK